LINLEALPNHLDEVFVDSCLLSDLFAVTDVVVPVRGRVLLLDDDNRVVVHRERTLSEEHLTLALHFFCWLKNQWRAVLID